MKRQTVDTPRDGKAWCDVINKEPLPAQPTRKVMAIGKCNRDGSGYESYDTPVVRIVPDAKKVTLWKGDFRL